MADHGPLLATWADVDPARHSFDPVEMSVAVRALVPPPPPPPAFRDGGWVGFSEAFAWVESVSVILADRYGQWAHRWYWGPGESGFVTDRIPTPAQAPTFVVDSLLAWRRWLENLAERFARILPSLDPARAVGAGDVVAAWEVAVAELMTVAAAPVVEYDDDWPGWCEITLRWFLTATGMPPEQAQALLDGALGERLHRWVPLTAVEVGEVAERVARAVLSPSGIMPAGRVGNWPDTWPQGWPSWRATNTGWSAG
ncbi:hypothetical protein ACGGAQ_08800 [Micromonospora sp. NPDC047557]|uniref:hypothetical protein n=1 Tax=Micromonospora sp. NPDC047557 TaxID=3364250 RepID=UPI0037163D5A